MKLILLLFISLGFNFLAVSQSEIKINESNHSFSTGNQPVIIVNIPYGKKDIVEKEIRSELKNWGGKYDSKKDEMWTIQADPKFMNNRAFDAYAKIVEEKDNQIFVAFAINLGGAYMNSKDHNEQFKAMSQKIKEFAKNTSLKCIDGEMEDQTKILSSLEKEQRSLEKDKKDFEGDIESHKKKIADLENKIKENEKTQASQKETIKAQESKISDIEKRKKGVK